MSVGSKRIWNCRSQQGNVRFSLWAIQPAAVMTVHTTNTQWVTQRFSALSSSAELTRCRTRRQAACSGRFWGRSEEPVLRLQWKWRGPTDHADGCAAGTEGCCWCVLLPTADRQSSARICTHTYTVYWLSTHSSPLCLHWGGCFLSQSVGLSVSLSWRLFTKLRMNFHEIFRSGI